MIREPETATKAGWRVIYDISDSQQDWSLWSQPDALWCVVIAGALVFFAACLLVRSWRDTSASPPTAPAADRPRPPAASTARQSLFFAFLFVLAGVFAGGVWTSRARHEDCVERFRKGRFQIVQGVVQELNGGEPGDKLTDFVVGGLKFSIRRRAMGNCGFKRTDYFREGMTVRISFRQNEWEREILKVEERIVRIGGRSDPPAR